MDRSRCLFCARAASDLVDVPSRAAKACRACLAQVGTILSEGGLRAAGLWPALLHADAAEDEAPEPMVRLADGRRVELREHTAALKRELTLEQRAELAATYVTIGLFREAVLEAALVLAGRAPPSAATAAIELLLAPPLGRPRIVETLQDLLRPS